MTEVLKAISIGLMSRGNDLVSFVSRRLRPLSADGYFDGRSSVGAIDEREAGLGLGGLTIQTIQIAAPATHARYAGWRKWPVPERSRCR